MSTFVSLVLDWLVSYIERAYNTWKSDMTRANNDETKNADIEKSIADAKTDEERKNALDKATRGL